MTRLTAGLSLPVAPGPPVGDPQEVLTDEAAVTARPAEDLRVVALVAEDEAVGQGTPLLRLKRHPDIVLTAPMAGRVASIELGPGHRLSQLVLFREATGDRFRHQTSDADSEAGLRRLLHGSGLWWSLRSRPFGRMPPPEGRPAAIFIMATATRPDAPDPRREVAGAEECLERGVGALARLTDGTVFLCQDDGAPILPPTDRVRVLRVRRLHPLGLAGLQIHNHRPADIGAPVWDIHVGDVAAMGELLATGYLPPTRLVSVAGAALRENRLVRCQPGADLRGLSFGYVRPGPHILLSGAALDGREARWLGPRSRQVTALPRQQGKPRPHWFRAALGRASRPLPIIPTAALDHSLGGALPVAALLRALASGDVESAARLGALSLLEEDLALADYVTCAEPRLSGQLRVLLDRIAAETAA